MIRRRILCFLSLFCFGRAEIAPTESYSHSAKLNSGQIKIYWKFNNTDIIFEVHGNTTGWVGIGFSPNGAMTGSDIFIGWVKNGQVTVTDRHATSNGFPELDPQQDANILGGEEKDGWTMYRFSRKLVACDLVYDRDITQDTQRLIWALGDEDPSGSDVTVDNYHRTNRGVKSLYLLESSATPDSLPNGPTYKHIDFLMDNYEVPNVETRYNCKLFKMPELDKKHHIVKAEAVIQGGNELNVHHMILYRCADTLQNEAELGMNGRCYTNEIKHFLTCTGVIAVWGVGGEPYYYPEEAGLSIGSEGDPIYVRLEIHYDNPKKEYGIIDNSGIRLTYTDTLRKHDVGIFFVGSRTVGTDVLIPPGSNRFLVTGRCSSTCIEERMNASNVENVTIFSSFLHTHTTGQSVRVRHIRGDTELPYLDHDEYYDFDYQQTRQKDPPVVLKSGDQLWTECVYNTEDRTSITEGGFGTHQEMCLAFLYYYPRIHLGNCISSVSRQIIWPVLGIDINATRLISRRQPFLLDSYEILTPDSLNGKSVREYLNEYNWTQDAIRSFESFYNSAPQQEICMPTFYDYSMLKPRVFNFSDIAKPYTPTHDVCLSATTEVGDAESTTSGSENMLQSTYATRFGCISMVFSLTNILN